MVWLIRVTSALIAVSQEHNIDLLIMIVVTKGRSSIAVTPFFFIIILKMGSKKLIKESVYKLHYFKLK